MVLDAGSDFQLQNVLVLAFAFELRGCENSVSVSQSQQKAFVFEFSNDFLIGQSAVRLSNRKHSLSFEPL